MKRFIVCCLFCVCFISLYVVRKKVYANQHHKKGGGHHSGKKISGGGGSSAPPGNLKLLDPNAFNKK